MLLLFATVYVFQRFANTDAVPVSILNFARDPSGSSPLPQECVCQVQRSVWDIVWSCLVTIFACSWVSIHPNIPPKGEPWWRKSLRRIELMVWSIVGPELMIGWAAAQWMGARELAKKYKKHGWTKTHGYFIQMGGFMLYKGETPVGVLHPKQLARLLKKQSIDMPTITEEEIRDHSKGDGLSKALVIVQTTWFVVQCIAWRSQGLFITQLELATLAFATLNGVMYYFWWNKPLNVESTFPVYLKSAPTEEERHIDNDRKGINTTDNDNNRKQEEDPADTDALIPLEPGVLLQSRRPENIGLNLKYLGRQIWRITSGILYHWPVAGFLAIGNRLDEITMFIDYNEPSDGKMCVGTFNIYSFSKNDGWGNIVLVCVGALFGVIHCAGWNFFFPSHVEALIWRISSVIITSPPVTLIVIGIINGVFSGSKLMKLIADALAVMVFIMVPAYVLARLALLVGALIALRALPQEAFATVKWTLALPHI